MRFDRNNWSSYSHLISIINDTRFLLERYLQMKDSLENKISERKEQNLVLWVCGGSVSLPMGGWGAGGCKETKYSIENKIWCKKTVPGNIIFVIITRTEKIGPVLDQMHHLCDQSSITLKYMMLDQ